MDSLTIIQTFISYVGADGVLSIRPSHLVLVNGESATIFCAGDRSFPTWKQDDFYKQSTYVIADNDCTLREGQSFDFGVNKVHGSSDCICDLIVKRTNALYTEGLTTRYICSDSTSSDDAEMSTAQMILIALGKTVDTILT